MEREREREKNFVPYIFRSSSSFGQRRNGRGKYEDTFPSAEAIKENNAIQEGNYWLLIPIFGSAHLHGSLWETYFGQTPLIHLFPLFTWSIQIEFGPAVHGVSTVSLRQVYHLSFIRLPLQDTWLDWTEFPPLGIRIRHVAFNFDHGSIQVGGHTLLNVSRR